jgi:polysaccharide export outer membrane protein
MNSVSRLVVFSLLMALGLHGPLSGAAETAAAPPPPYLIQPGDVLVIMVWKETDLQQEVVVRPDGGVSFPLGGDLPAAGGSTETLREMLRERLKKYIDDPVVTVSVKVANGNRIYVQGKVNRTGEFPLLRPTDVMQALALAGGLTPFAEGNNIRVLRRENGQQVVLRFRYGDVSRGRHLEQNVLLRSGDTVVVP